LGVFYQKHRERKTEVMERWKPLFSLVHATARPLGWQAAYAQYCRMAKDPGCFEYILCFDEAQEAAFRKTVSDEWFLNEETCCSPRVRIHPGPRNYVSAANYATRDARAPIVLEVTDDMFPPMHWDIEIRKAIPLFREEPVADPVLRYVTLDIEDQEHVLWVHDGAFPHIMTMQIFTSKWYERYGYVFHSDFPSMLGDHEFTWRANRDGVIIDMRDRPEMRWDHQHHRNAKRAKDASDIPNESASRYCEGWKALAKHCPGYMKVDPIDALYASACATPGDIYEHLPALKALASPICATCSVAGWMLMSEKCPDCNGAWRTPKSILELGTRTGNSTIAFLAGGPKLLVSVDLDFSHLDPQVDGAAMYSEIPFHTIQQDSAKPVKCTSCRGSGTYPIEALGKMCEAVCQRCNGTGSVDFDVVFFDTWHTYAHLKAEIYTHAPHCRERLAFHDTGKDANYDRGEDGSTPGLWAAIEELVAAGEWEIESHDENCHGLTILHRRVS
jgi:hypothetical protein